MGFEEMEKLLSSQIESTVSLRDGILQMKSSVEFSKGNLASNQNDSADVPELGRLQQLLYEIETLLDDAVVSVNEAVNELKEQTNILRS